MKRIKTLMLLGLISSMASLFIAACTDNEESKDSKKEAKGDHVWKHQTDALKTSKDVAKQLQEQLNQQQQKLDENN
jgi:outer membrane biogenesis lipoprotein LolB